MFDELESLPDGYDSTPQQADVWLWYFCLLLCFISGLLEADEFDEPPDDDDENDKRFS